MTIPGNNERLAYVFPETKRQNEFNFQSKSTEFLIEYIPVLLFNFAICLELP